VAALAAAAAQAPVVYPDRNFFIKRSSWHFAQKKSRTVITVRLSPTYHAENDIRLHLTVI
jgi:hypothetical protein